MSDQTSPRDGDNRDEPAIDPEAAERAANADTYDTAGYGEAYAAVETEASIDEVEEAWEEAESDADQADLRLMDPGDRPEPGRTPREGE